MDEKKFSELARRLVAEYNNEVNPEKQITPDDVYVVWMCKTLQNSKAMLSTPVPDTRYYEVTYNGDKGEAYLDTYVKEKNDCIKVMEG
ncbi:DUF6275 family protein [uncultured Subdoligranulum sp.]|uniref:DUF6275 family protein n=1 Tax=uncultured Subdoligranulum sp. TaxID=512298 RepID=UPI0025E826B6|nr:DUF6275 family protein [uncultured Subdoligranulum sp.]